MRDGVGGASLHAIAAEDTAVVIDVVDGCIALAAADANFVRILRGFVVLRRLEYE